MKKHASPSRTINSRNNMIFTYLNQIVNILIHFICRSIFIHVLGVEFLGIGSLFSDVLQLLSLADLGFTTAMAYSFYKPIAENNETKIAALIHFYQTIYRVIAIVILLLGLLCIPLLKYIVNTDREIPNLVLYYILYLLNTVVSYLFVYKTTLLTAMQKNYLLLRMKMIVNVIMTGAQIAALLIFKNFIVYLILLVLSTLAQNLYPSHMITKFFPYLKQKAELSKEEKKFMFKNVRSVFIYKVSGKLGTSTDNIMISTLIGTLTVGYFSNYYMILTNLTTFISGIFSSLTASVGNMLVSKTDTDEKKYLIFKTEQLASDMIATICVICFGLLINDFVNMWLGKEFVLSAAVVAAISFNFYLTCVFQPLWSFREASGLYIKTKYVNVATAGVNIVLSLILGMNIGLFGILIATPISKLITYFLYEPFVLFKTFFNKSAVEFYTGFLLNLLITLFILSIAYFTTSWLEVRTWIDWFLKAVIIGSVAVVLSLLAHHQKKGFGEIAKRVKVMLNFR